jgi:hypothetical protein
MYMIVYNFKPGLNFCYDLLFEIHNGDFLFVKFRAMGGQVSSAPVFYGSTRQVRIERSLNNHTDMGVIRIGVAKA